MNSPDTSTLRPINSSAQWSHSQNKTRSSWTWGMCVVEQAAKWRSEPMVGESHRGTVSVDRVGLKRSDFAVRRVPLTFAWKKTHRNSILAYQEPHTKKHQILLKRPHGTLSEKRRKKTAVSAPLYRALSHIISRRRSPGFAVRWRPEWPVLYRASASDGRPPPAGRRPSLAHSRGCGRVVSVRRLSRCWSRCRSRCRTRCRSRCQSRARSHARGGGLGKAVCALSPVIHAMRTLLTYSHVAGRVVVMRARRDEEREDEREERREDETAAMERTSMGVALTSDVTGRG